MSETATIGPTVRTIFPGSADEGDGNRVEHVDLAKRSLLSRIVGRTIWPGREGEPAKQAPRQPQIPPEEELPIQRQLLEHLEGQLRSAKAILAGDPNRPSSTAMTAVHAVTQHYVKLLSENADVAATPMVDVPLLVYILSRPGEGLITAVAQRVAQLEGQLRVPAAPKAEHKKKIQAAVGDIRKAAASIRTLWAFEDKTALGQRHEFRTERPVCGPNYNQLSRRELVRFVEFAEALPVPDSK
jgi:hypothetical protein